MIGETVEQVIGKDAIAQKEDAMNQIAKEEEINEEFCEVLRNLPWSWRDDPDQLPLPETWWNREQPVDSLKSHDADEAGENDAEQGWPQTVFGCESDAIPDEDHVCNI